MTGRWQAKKREVVQTARKMAELGLVAGTSRNVSVWPGARFHTVEDANPWS